MKFALEAESGFRGLPKHVQRKIAPCIDGLAHAPRPRGVEPIEGGEELYRLDVEGCRIVYQIREDGPVVLVLRVGRLKSAVSLLKRTQRVSLQIRRRRRRRRDP